MAGGGRVADALTAAGTDWRRTCGHGSRGDDAGHLDVAVDDDLTCTSWRRSGEARWSMADLAAPVGSTARIATGGCGPGASSWSRRSCSKPKVWRAAGAGWEWPALQLRDGGFVAQGAVVEALVHGTTYEEVRKVSPLVGSRHGLDTAEDSMEVIAAKIAELVHV